MYIKIPPGFRDYLVQSLQHEMEGGASLPLSTVRDLISKLREARGDYIDLGPKEIGWVTEALSYSSGWEAAPGVSVEGLGSLSKDVPPQEDSQERLRLLPPANVSDREN